MGYGGLTRIAKRVSASGSRTEEMFERLEQARLSLQINQKIRFHQIGILSNDSKKTAFKTKHSKFEYTNGNGVL